MPKKKMAARIYVRVSTVGQQEGPPQADVIHPTQTTTPALDQKEN